MGETEILKKIEVYRDLAAKADCDRPLSVIRDLRKLDAALKEVGVYTIVLRYKSIVFVAVCDKTDFETHGGWSWQANYSNGFKSRGRTPKFYAARMTRYRDNDGLVRWYKVYLHREIIGAKRGEIVDHINGDPLDNRRMNLRIVTQIENMANVYGSACPF